MSQLFLSGPLASISASAKPKIVLVEDDPEDLKNIRFELAKYDLERLDTTTRRKELFELLDKTDYDAVSIDWELHGVEKGGEILQELITKYPEVGRVVFTQHTQRLQEAMDLGADACVFKKLDGDLTEYTAAMRNAARLGLARHIAERLNKLGQNHLPSLPVGSLEIDEQTEIRLYEKARQVALRYRADGTDDGGLRELLIRRGWWMVIGFDSGAFVQLKKHEKINLLAKYAGATAAEISTILEITEPQVTEYLSQGSFSEAVGQNVTDALDRLLSILGFVLRLSGYDPELMPYFWQVREYFKESFEKPPWNEVGLSDYLKAQGQQGLTEVLNWIRSH